MHDRHVESLCHVTGKVRCAAVFRIGREPHLVVGNDVESTAGVVAAQVGQVERLGHDTLCGEGGVTVHEDRKAAARRMRSPPGVARCLHGSCISLDRWVHTLEVARIRH